MIAVTVSRVQATGSELASAENRAERQLTERVTTIAEDIIGELLHSRIKLNEPDSQEQQAYDEEELETERAKLKRSLSVSGPLTTAEVRRLEAARPFLLRRRPLRPCSSRIDNPNPTRRTAYDGLLKPPLEVSRPASPMHSIRLSDASRRRTGRPVGDTVDSGPAGSNQTSTRFSVFDSRASFESLHRPRPRKLSNNDPRESSINVNFYQEETPVGLEESRPSADNLLDSNDGDSANRDDAKRRKRHSQNVLYKHARAAIWSSIGIIAYCLLGGLFVSLIEGPHETQCRAYKQEQHELLLQSLLYQLHINESSDTEVTSKLEQLVTQFENDMISAMKSTVPDGEPTWTFVRSWFFSWTVITTIGYGNYTPVTQLGRVWVMVFGMVGIPLVVLNTMRFGRLITQMTIYARGKLLHWFRKRLDNDSETAMYDAREVAANYMPPWVAVTLLPTYCAIMAAVFCAWEPWDYFDSFYFTFVTLAGIGLGDIAPSKEEVMILFTVFKMIGLGLFALFMEMGAIQFARLGKRVKQCGKVWASKSKISGASKKHNQPMDGKQVDEV